LAIWWSGHFKRPLKDPLLSEYTLEELIYEYYIVKEKSVYEEETRKEETDKIEEAKIKDDEKWADEMEAEFASTEQEGKKSEPKEEQLFIDPSKDPKNIEWMEKEIENSKSFFGEDFGEDLSLSFDDLDKDR
jgi:hypothetical protein